MKYTSAQDGRDILFSFRNDCLQSILCLKKFWLEIIFYKIGRFCYGKLYINFNPLSFWTGPVKTDSRKNTPFMVV